MNPHELIKHSLETATISDGFTERVLQAAKAPPARSKLKLRLLPIAAAVVVCLALTVAAAGALRHWLSGVVDVKDETLLDENNSGELLLECEDAGMHIKYGNFICVGRFLYLEVELQKADGTEITEQDVDNAVFLDTAHGLTLQYDTPYLFGPYSAQGEGYTGYRFRLDDGSEPGYARYTLAWTLSRHDYAGQTLHLQLWEPYEWECQPDGSMVSTNDETRAMLAEATILRETPKDERVMYFDNGDEVRICAFGMEIQGLTFINTADRVFHAAYEAGQSPSWQDCGVLLTDGTRVPFNPNINAPTWHELGSELHWAAAPFSATVDPQQVSAVYLGDTVLPLHP